jgi:ferredoxin
MTIFYFTGTGNSLFTAKRIAEKTGAKLVSIPQVINEKHDYTDDVIGFIYPQYAVGLPKMVRRFVLNNTFKADYFFAIDLYATLKFGALRELGGIIPLNYGAYLKTPGNFLFFFAPPKNPQAILNAAKLRIDSIVADISAKKSKPVKPSKKIGNATKYFGRNEYGVSGTCRKCGLCISLCPAGNITIKETVEFGQNCEVCYGCINSCPVHAINEKGKDKGRPRYRNPEITLEEIIEANNQNNKGAKMP